MKILGIETSSSVFSVAVCEDDKVLASLKIGGFGRPSSLLTDLIQQVLGYAQMELTQIDALAVSIGPGSFTGLRIGVMTVKTLAWALKKPIVPVSSLEVIARNVGMYPDSICPFLDARKGKVYSALFSAPDGKFKRLASDQLSAPEKILAALPEKVLLIGDGLKRYVDLVQSSGKEKQWLQAPASLWIPHAELLCRIVVERWPADKLDDPHGLVPQYLYSQESDITGW